jgi:3'(2'), 5'-bisphosphate nucleotidase
VPRQTLLEALLPLARQAGDAILRVYAGDFVVDHKRDASPLTQADLAAEAIITAGLLALTPGIPVVAEEAVARTGDPAVGRSFWLVDPLDGTREFVQRNGEFTVNIALIEDGVPVCGVVFAPAIDLLFCGAQGQGATMVEGGVRGRIECRVPPAQGLDVLVSRRHDDDARLREYLRGRPVAAMRPAGSSLKFGLIAAGRADLYPRLSRTMEWDTAAGHAVLRAAGGEVSELSGAPLRYGKPGFENPHFVARGRS